MTAPRCDTRRWTTIGLADGAGRTTSMSARLPLPHRGRTDQRKCLVHTPGGQGASPVHPAVPIMLSLVTPAGEN